MGICAEGKAYLPHRFKILLNCILRQYQKPPFSRLTGWLKGEGADCGVCNAHFRQARLDFG
jgi:hypothetical protein